MPCERFSPKDLFVSLVKLFSNKYLQNGNERKADKCDFCEISSFDICE